MKVLFLTHRVPFPPNRGDRIRSFHVLRHLADRAVVDLACLTDEPVSESHRQALQSMCRRLAIVPQGRRARWTRAILSLAGGRSATEGLFRSPELARTLSHWAADADYDRVLVYCSSMFQYSTVGRLRQVPCIVDLVDIDSQKWFDYAQSARRPLRWLYRWEGRRVRRLERDLVEQAQAVTVVSDVERDVLREFCPRARAHVFANGVDPARFQPDPEGIWPGIEKHRETGQQDCVFVGALDYRPNVDGVSWFCREVWPEIHTCFRQTRFVLIGRRPSSQVRKLARQPGVELVGEVADVLPYLWRSRLVVVPLRIARGIQNKVLEALAARKPVIASSQALEGLDVVPGEHLLKADSPGEWIGSISTLLMNEGECRRLGAAGRDFVACHHQWDDCLQPIDELLGISERGRTVAKSSPALSQTTS